jgi:hypothetical protein
MQNNCSTFNIPLADKEPVDIFDTPATATNEVSDIYTELNQIAEELEECRLRNC